MARAVPKLLEPKKALNDKRGLYTQDAAEWKAFFDGEGIKNVKIVGRRNIMMCCPMPDHHDQNASAQLSLDKRIFRCYAANCGAYYTDPIALVATICNSSYKDAIEIFKRRFSKVKLLKRADVSKYYAAEALYYKRMALVSATFHETLLQIWDNKNRQPREELVYQYLYTTRQVTDPASIHCLGVMPNYSTFKQILLSPAIGGTLEDLTWIEAELLEKHFSTRTHNQITFTCGVSYDEITSFRLRPPPGHAMTNRSVIKRSDDDPNGVFGINNAGYKPLLNNKDFKHAAVVEGEFDQILWYQNQVSKGLHNEVVVSMGGTGHDGLDLLADLGLTHVKIIPDDDEGGLGFVEGLLQKTSRAACQVFSWDEKLRPANPAIHMDPDLAIRTYGFDKMYKHFSDDKKNYVYAYQWCFQRVEEKLDGVDASDVRQQEDIAIDYGRKLNNETDLQAFCELIAADYPLLPSSSVFRHVRESEDSELSFEHNMKAWILRKFHVIYIDDERNELHLWNKAKRRRVTMKIDSPQNIVGTFCQHIKVTLAEWARDEIGLPASYPPLESEDGEGAQYDKVTDKVIKRLCGAIRMVSSSAAPKPDVEIAQGVHLHGITDPSATGFVVNGTRIYSIIWNNDGTNFNAVEELDGPSHGDTVFNTRALLRGPHVVGAQWLPCIDSAKDFWRKPKYTIQQCYDKVHHILSSVCEFKYQKADIMYATLLVMYQYIVSGIQRKVLTHLLGEFESGKSSALSLIAGGEQLAEYTLGFHGHASDSITRANIFQKYTGACCLLGIDEVNDTGAEYNNKVRELYKSLRGLATKGNADRDLGSTSQQAIYQSMACAVVTAGATDIYDDMDYSRFNTLQLIKNPLKANTRLTLHNIERDTPGIFEELRHSIFINMLRAAPRIARFNEGLPKLVNDGIKFRLDRTVENLMPLTAIAMHIGLDYLAFLTEFCTARQSDHATRKRAQDGDALLDRILSSTFPIIIPGTDEVKEMPLLAAFRTAALREAINETGYGIYFDETDHCIGIAWQGAHERFLNRDHKYRNMAPVQLRNMVRRMSDVHHIREESARKSGLADRLSAKGLYGVPWLSYFNVKAYVAEAEKAQAASNPLAAAGTLPEAEDVDTGMNL